MDIILLERVERLGSLGDIVSVKTGYARNYLLPQKKALRASKENLARFESEKAELEKRNQERLSSAEQLSSTIEGAVVTMIRAASEEGQLYGSVSARDIADGLNAINHQVSRQQVLIGQPIKSIGLHDVKIRLHAEVEANVKINVAKSDDEAERQLEEI